MTLDRRQLLKALGLAALAPGACVRQLRRHRPDGGAGVVLNDVHSKLNRTRVDRVAAVDSLESLRRAVRGARADGRAVSIGGGRHAMGGQQFGAGTVHVDTRPLDRVLSFDTERGIIEVEAGIQWPELIDRYLEAQAGSPGQNGTGGSSGPWGIAQKQSGADRFCLGGSLAANVHGRGLTMKPIVSDVESFTLVDAAGELRHCSRDENVELFRLAIGGYGLFGPIYSIRLRLARRRKLERLVQVRSADGLDAAFEQRVADGFLYGDFKFSIDPTSESFLQEGIFSCYRPTDPETPIPSAEQRPSPRRASTEEARELPYLAHVDEARAFWLYSMYYLSTSGQAYWSDLQQLATYAEDYHRALDRRLPGDAPGSEMLSELYVPRAEMSDYLAEAADWLRDSDAEVVYGTVRIIERDDETFLPWARRSSACVAINLHVDHTPAGVEKAKRQFRGLIDLARARSGSFFLTYHPWATREQIEDCYPEMQDFLRAKLRHDPDERFQSDWYRHLRGLFPDVGVEETAPSRG